MDFFHFSFSPLIQAEGEVLRLRKGLTEAQRRAEEYRQERDAAVKDKTDNKHAKGLEDVVQQNQHLK